MRIFECDQRSEAWFLARAGIPTSSEFATVLAKGKGSAESVTRRRYMLKLAGERFTGEPSESYENQNMIRGREMEPEARDFYAFVHDVEPRLIGFVTTDDGMAGCSPDSFIGDAGMLEIKTSFPHVLIELMLKGGFPPEYRAQCQGALWVAEREWIDLSVY